MSTATPRKTPRACEGEGGGERPAAAAHDKKALGALQKLREIIKTAQEQFQSTTERAGISGSQAWALSEIAARPGMIVSELGKVMAIHPSTTSNMLDKMQKRGLIRRERIDSDQRVVRLFVTGEGDALLRALPAPARGLLPDALARLSDDELDRVDTALGLILEKLERRERRAGYTPLASLIAKRDGNGGRAGRERG